MIAGRHAYSNSAVAVCALEAGGRGEGAATLAPTAAGTATTLSRPIAFTGRG